MSVSQGLGEKTDSLLVQQLDQPRGPASIVQAWFQLKTEAKVATTSSQDVTSQADSLLQRIQTRLGKSPESVKILSNLNSFMVAAHPDFIRELIKQPEIQSARSTNVPDFGLIRPVKSEPVTLQSTSPKKRRSRVGKPSR